MGVALSSPHPMYAGNYIPRRESFVDPYAYERQLQCCDIAIAHFQDLIHRIKRGDRGLTTLEDAQARLARAIDEKRRKLGLDEDQIADMDIHEGKEGNALWNVLLERLARVDTKPEVVKKTTVVEKVKGLFKGFLKKKAGKEKDLEEAALITKKIDDDQNVRNIEEFDTVDEVENFEKMKY